MLAVDDDQSVDRPTADKGSALIITIMFIAVLAALATTVTSLAIGNLQSSTLAREAGVAANAADAGIAEGVSYLRTNGVGSLCARPTAYDASTPSFDRAMNVAKENEPIAVRCVDGPTKATRVSGQPYSVLIVTDVGIAGSDVGRYLIYSVGVGGGAARRIATAEVEVKGVGAPRGGFFGHTVSGSGTAKVNQSIFSTGCVYQRNRITMTGVDSYGLPAAVHSSAIITDDNGTTPTCGRSGKSIHDSGPCLAQSDGYFDQDVLGGSLVGTSCWTARSAYPASTPWAKYYPDGSRIADKGTLFALFGLKDPALSQAEIDELRSVAKAQGNYRTTSGASDQVTPNGTNAVLFYELNNGKVDLGTIKGFEPPTTGCLPKSLIVLVSGGDVVFPSGPALAASVFVTTPAKSYTPTGGQLVGTAYADSITLGGNSIVSTAALDCFAANPSPSLLAFNVTAYREIDG